MESQTPARTYFLTDDDAAHLRALVERFTINSTRQQALLEALAPVDIVPEEPAPHPMVARLYKAIRVAVPGPAGTHLTTRLVPMLTDAEYDALELLLEDPNPCPAVLALHEMLRLSKLAAIDVRKAYCAQNMID